MSEILIDSAALQADQHLKAVAEGKSVARLSSFLEAVGKFGSVAFTQTRTIEPSELSRTELLVIPTRPPYRPFEGDTIARIGDFVMAGGSLLLMSNHSRSPNSNMGHYTAEDGRLAHVFGVRILEAAFRNPERGELTSIEDAGAEPHPILCHGGQRLVGSVVINNCSAISHRSENGRPVLLLDDGMEDMGPNDLRSGGEAFAWSIDGFQEVGGRVLIAGDSGFIGEPDLPGSGPGLLNRAHNQLFVERTIAWLLGRW